VVIALVQSWQPTFVPNLDGGKYHWKKERQHLQTRLRNASTHPPVPEHPMHRRQNWHHWTPPNPLVRCNWDFAALPVCANRVRRGIPKRVNRRVCHATHQRKTAVTLWFLCLPCWAFLHSSLS
jgi:hypothetical protein